MKQFLVCLHKKLLPGVWPQTEFSCTALSSVPQHQQFNINVIEELKCPFLEDCRHTKRLAPQDDLIIRRIMMIIIIIMITITVTIIMIYVI